MSTLTSLLVRDQAVPLRKIEEALQRQVISGGSIETVLLEMDVIEENVLASYGAALAELKPAARDDLMHPSHEALSRPPRELVLEHGFMPFSLTDAELSVATQSPFSAEQLAAWSERIGLKIVPFFGLEVRIAAALELHFGHTALPRLRELAVKLADRDPGTLKAIDNVPPRALRMSIPSRQITLSNDEDDVAPKSTPTVVGVPSPDIEQPANINDIVEMHPVVTSMSVPAAGRKSVPTGASNLPLQTMALMDSLARGAHVPSVRPRLSLAEASKRAIEAVSRDAVLDLFFGFAEAYFDFAVLFVVQDDVAFARIATHSPTRTNSLSDVRVSLSASSLFRAMRATGKTQIADLDQNAVDEELAREFERNARSPSACIPICIRDRIVCFVWGDRNGQKISEKDLSELIAFRGPVTRGLEEVIRRRKIQNGGLSLPPTLISHHDAITVPGRTPDELLQASQPTPDGTFAPRSRPPAFDALFVPKTPPPPPAVSTSLAPSAPAISAIMRASLPPPVVPVDLIPMLQRARSVPPPDPREEPDAEPPPRIERASAPPMRRTSLPPNGRFSQRPGLTFGDDTGAANDNDATLHSPTKPRVISSLPPQSLPSVIVDMGDDVNAVVRELDHATRDNADALIERLLALGEPALPALAQRFPGRPWLDFSIDSVFDGRLPRARDISGMARGLAAFMGRSAPYLEPLIESANTRTRFSALIVAGEISAPQLVPTIGQRIFDEDRFVSRLAFVVLKKCERMPEYTLLVETLRSVARQSSQPVEARRHSVWALRELRDGKSVGTLIPLLDEAHGTLVTETERALATITRQDLGPTRKAWDLWAEKNLGRHRIEWLIDALLHADESIRSAASDELKRTTHEYFGFHPSAPKKDRERVHKKYAQWWQDDGKKRFR